uniref:Uncharacterized protein n=1 Tax=Octopus bimaculoides TaxID=37653 RepID=A0A0L8HLD3_OCTBM
MFSCTNFFSFTQHSDKSLSLGGCIYVCMVFLFTVFYIFYPLFSPLSSRCVDKNQDILISKHTH